MREGWRGEEGERGGRERGWGDKKKGEGDCLLIFIHLFPLQLKLAQTTL